MIEYKGEKYELVQREGITCKDCCFNTIDEQGRYHCTVIDEPLFNCGFMWCNGVFKEVPSKEENK